MESRTYSSSTSLGDQSQLISKAFAHHQGRRYSVQQRHAQSHEELCQKVDQLREQPSKSTQDLEAQLNLTKELIEDKKEKKRRGSIFDQQVDSNSDRVVLVTPPPSSQKPNSAQSKYSCSADELIQMRKQNRLGKVSLTTMKHLSSVDHRRSSGLLGVNTLHHLRPSSNGDDE
ncbi:hypothetical protein C9374_013452 [Naegleria lovaniensis]|uniref:Uncharacterized protein n=1 Tax=Naegleria lovaniensis TaxID=51637 RepID=A0AA88H2C8_NAELO|nr:uncharacterized protein C9374_013452 [Naegleria lovaniensis]KAG2391967.1 hypothetical protein C9374_013452 [Naegleria lovaniensis]